MYQSCCTLVSGLEKIRIIGHISIQSLFLFLKNRNKKQDESNEYNLLQLTNNPLMLLNVAGHPNLHIVSYSSKISSAG